MVAVVVAVAVTDEVVAAVLRSLLIDVAYVSLVAMVVQRHRCLRMHRGGKLSQPGNKVVLSGGPVSTQTQFYGRPLSHHVTHVMANSQNNQQQLLQQQQQRVTGESRGRRAVQMRRQLTVSVSMDDDRTGNPEYFYFSKRTGSQQLLPGNKSFRAIFK